MGSGARAGNGESKNLIAGADSFVGEDRGVFFLLISRDYIGISRGDRPPERATDLPEQATEVADRATDLPERARGLADRANDQARYLRAGVAPPGSRILQTR